jgi:hypothetical protein
MYARYAAVMSGSWAPIERCPILGCYRDTGGIIPRIAQSKRADHSASGATKASELHRERKLCALAYHLSEKSRAGGPGEFDCEILPDQGNIARDHDDLEVSRPRLKQPASPCRFLDENFAPLAEEL